MKATGRTCTCCGQYKTAAHFLANPKVKCGLNSWCKTCTRISTKLWRDNNTSYTEATVQEKRTYPDPIEYSKNVCAHVEAYVERAIDRFEKKHSCEAPPHLQALLNTARSIKDEHPQSESLAPVITCIDCKCQVTATRYDQKRCAECRTRKRSLTTSDLIRHNPDC